MDELAQWKSFACRVTRTMSDTGGGSRGDDRIQKSYEKIEALRHWLEQDIQTLLEMREEILQHTQWRITRCAYCCGIITSTESVWKKLPKK